MRPSIRRYHKVLLILGVIALVAITLALVKTQKNVIQLQNSVDHQIQDIRNQQNSTIKSGQVQIQTLQQEQKTKDSLIQDLNTKLESKKAAVIRLAQVQPSPVSTPKVMTAVSGAKLWIYNHESGNNPWSVNKSSGACGIGQALPCSKMPCQLGNYACQDAFFTSYMIVRYGTWENAQAWWIAHSWW